MGGHVERCGRCGFERPAYNSCRNRHCPKCQARKRAAWLDARSRDLLPVETFHVVFTLPEEISAIGLQNKREIYSLLFRAVAETLQQVAADPRHLGAEIGFLAVLHTWGQNLRHHPHVHCVIPGGGLSRDGTRWIPCRRGFFLPVRVLSKVFRGKFLDLLGETFRQGRLRFQGELASLERPERFLRVLRDVRRKPWVVYAKRPFAGPEAVLKYLARYTHRVAISNQRLVSLAHGEVTFRWKDYRMGRRMRVMTLDAVEFIRRFLQHTLPKAFVRIRHFGFLSNRCRHKKIALCRRLLGVTRPVRPLAENQGEATPPRCPACGRGTMHRVRPLPRAAAPTLQPVPADTS